MSAAPTRVPLAPGVAEAFDVVCPYVYVRDEERVILHAGPGLVAEFGEPAGRRCHEYFKGCVRPCGTCIDPDDRDSAEICCEEIVLSDGVVLRLRKRRFHAADGRALVVGLGDDVTALVKARSDREATAKALLNSEARHLALSEGSSDLCWILGEDGAVIFVAPAVTRLLGETDIDLIGRDLGDLLHPDDAPALERVLARSLARPDERVEAPDLRVRRGDGEWATLSGTVSNMIAHRHVGGLVFNARDVTAEKRAKREIRRQLELIEGAAYGCAVFDRLGTVLFVNEALAELLGGDVAEVTGRHVRDFVVLEGGADPDGIVARIFADEAIAGAEVELRRVDGGVFPALVSVHAVSGDDGEPAFATCSIIDVTEKVAAEREVRLLNTDLEARVEERTAEVIRLHDRLVEAKKAAALGSLVAGMAHELNTPVGVSLTASSLLAQKTMEYEMLYQEKRLSKANFETYLRVCSESTSLIMNNLHRTAKLIDAFKRTSVESSGVRVALHGVGDLLARLRVEFDKLYGPLGYEMAVECAEGLVAAFDPDILLRSLNLLVDNAVVHGYRGGQHGCVRVSAEKAGDAVAIRVADDGCGMSEEVRLRACDPFFTGDRVKGGVGLGLHILLTQITGALDGRVAVDSAPGRGTTVTVEIPLVSRLAD